MTVTAATHSAVLATAPAPRRLHYGEVSAYQQKQKAMMARAIELLEPAGGVYASQEKKNEIKNILKAEFGLDNINSNTLVAGAGSRIQKNNYGSSNAHLKSTPMTFSSPDAAKALARDKMGQLEYGVQNYNIDARNWSAAKIIEGRQKMWQTEFEGRLKHNGGDEAEAIKWADDSLKYSIENAGETVARYQIRLGLGGLEAFGPLPANLLIENADGTLTINRDALKDTTLGNALNIGSHLGQQVDKAA